jgi:hypothetical protein
MEVSGQLHAPAYVIISNNKALKLVSPERLQLFSENILKQCNTYKAA